MKHKTAELTGALLDAAVAKAEDLQGLELYEGRSWCLVTREGKTTVPILVDAYSTDWACGGPIIERERISLISDSPGREWRAAIGKGADMAVFYSYGPECGQYEGPTPLIAAMRAYVASKLGDEVELP